MKKINLFKTTAFMIIIFFILSNWLPAYASQTKENDLDYDVNFISLKLTFSEPEIVSYEDNIIVRVENTDLNTLDFEKPVLPGKLFVYDIPFGSKIIEISYNNSDPIEYNLPQSVENEDENPFPADWVTYNLGSGLRKKEHRAFLSVRVYPVRYFPSENKLKFIENINVTISYASPAEPILKNNDVYDLLILSPSIFSKNLQPLVTHKNEMGVKTNLINLEQVYEEMYWDGRDDAEKIKYFIKRSIEDWGISHVLLVGGVKRQTNVWNLPIRYSHVVPPTEQEYAETNFISDLYFADIYNKEGLFCSWDSNNNGIFAEWNDTVEDEMDIYPDVYLGRLPCRSNAEVKTMVKKIINYEKEKADDSWFKNFLLVTGDHWNDTAHLNEGELITEEAINVMPSFNPVKVYASETDINRETVNNALNPGAGFAYFCGHGSTSSWSTHFPPNGTEWTGSYKIGDMIFLKNGLKQPVTVVGGCHNGQFDVTMWNIIEGIKKDGLKYFRTKPSAGQFWFRQWVPNCWAWWLTSKINGGAIATIANTGLGTHAQGDYDNNSVADYIELLDGWLELRFFQLFGEENMDILGENYGETITDYLNRFIGDNWKMDIKMAQQWQLFGDPSLKIGGYT